MTGICYNYHINNHLAPTRCLDRPDVCAPVLCVHVHACEFHWNWIQYAMFSFQSDTFPPPPSIAARMYCIPVRSDCNQSNAKQYGWFNPRLLPFVRAPFWYCSYSILHVFENLVLIMFAIEIRIIQFKLFFFPSENPCHRFIVFVTAGNMPWFGQYVFPGIREEKNQWFSGNNHLASVKQHRE